MNMKMKKLIVAALASLSSLGFAGSAAADTLAVGDGWKEFSFGGVGSAWSKTFDFTLVGATLLKVTDAFQSGDRFDVTNFGASLGLTSLPGSVGDQINANYDAAFADSRWSSVSFLLAPGSYSISGTTVLSPFGGGGAAVRLAVAAVPEPSTYAMLLAGLGMLGLIVRRRAQV